MKGKRRRVKNFTVFPRVVNVILYDFFLFPSTVLVDITFMLILSLLISETTVSICIGALIGQNRSAPNTIAITGRCSNDSSILAIKSATIRIKELKNKKKEKI